MSEKLSTPKFLTPAVASTAVACIFEMMFSPASVGGVTLRNEGGHIVILVPAMLAWNTEPEPLYPNNPIRPHVLYEESNLDAEDWKYDYKNIAQCKALQLWQDRNDDRTDCIPHLLFPSDTPFYGGVKRRGIVVAYSGEEPYIDKMISGMVADMCVGLAHAAWMASPDKKATDGEECFIGL